MKKKCFEVKFACFMLALFSFFLVPGCGRKAPPIPPGIPDILAVRKISHTIDGGRLTLSWQKPKASRLSGLKSYAVHRSKTGINEKKCEGCPVLFKRIAELDSDTNTYGEVLEKGFAYIYKVVAISKYDTISPDSSFIKFTY